MTKHVVLIVSCGGLLAVILCLFTKLRLNTSSLPDGIRIHHVAFHCGINVDSMPPVVRKVVNRPLHVYFGASGVEQPGFVAFEKHELDVTVPASFHKLFCPSSVDIFFSEHTLEHIPPDRIPTVMQNLIRYLKPGGLFRFAIPPYRQGHNRTDLDLLYGHVWTPDIDEVKRELTKAGFVNITLLEYPTQPTKKPSSPFQPPLVTSEWDACKGRVVRSVKYDSRNVAFLKENFAKMSLTYLNEVGNNIIRDHPVTFSLIVDSRKPL